VAGTVLGIVSGFLLGIIGSYLAWLWTVRAYVPKLSVSAIARSTVSEQPPKYKYRIKVLNRGRHSVSDISISSRVFIPGLNPERPTNLTSLHIPVADERPFPVLEGRKGRIYTLRVSEAGGGGIERLPQEVRKRVDDGQISLTIFNGGGYCLLVSSDTS
jgi:hypothetical protein